MKIGIVCYPTIGGSGVVATELGHALANHHHEVHFIGYEIPFRLRLENPQIYFHEVDITEYDIFRYPDYALTLAAKMAEVSKECSLDILHVHYAIPHATSAYLAKQILGKDSPAVVTTLHGTDITLIGRDPAYSPIVKFSIENSDGVTAVSESLRQQTYQIFGHQKQIQVIYNFFVPNEELIGEKPLRSHFVQGEEKLLLHASNFRNVKRVEDVIQIYHEVLKQIPCKLVLVGSGEGLQQVKSLVMDLQLQKQVIFVGKILSIDPYVASSDLFLLPSSQESFGLAALEAMAYGVPVVASNIGGIPEVVVNGETGFLSPVGDIADMSRSVVRLLSDPELYRKMSLAAIARSKKFSVENILPQYEQFYENYI